MYGLKNIILKKLDKLYEFDKITPVYFDIENPIEILKKYDEEELYKIIQFDVEIKSILEHFFAVCYTSRILCENINFKVLENNLKDVMNPEMFLRQIQLMDLLKEIANYYDFIEIKSDISLYHKNLKIIIDLLKEIFNDIEELKDEATDAYMYYILSSNIEMINSEILNNKLELKEEFRNILAKNYRKMDFSKFSYISIEYFLAVFRQESLLDCIQYFNNIYEFISFYSVKNKISKSITIKYEKILELFEENQKISKKLYDSQNAQSLI